MKYTINLTVNTHDTDMHGAVRPSVILRYMQEAANLQMNHTHPSSDELRFEMGKAFILSKVTVNIYSDLRAEDQIEVSTWANESEGVSFRRSAQIRKNGVIIAEMISVWALLNIETRRLCRVRDIQLGFDTEPEYPEIDEPERLRMPADLTPKLMGTRTVYYSDIDCNAHMNNTNYPDMLLNFLPDIKDKKVYSFAIHFMNEARLDTSFKVYVANEPEKTYFKTVLPDGKVGVEAIFMIEDR